MSAATLVSILSNALLLPRWPASRRVLKIPTALARALSTAAPRLRRSRHDKDLFYVSKKKPSVSRSSTAEVAPEPAVARSDRYPDYSRLLPCPLQNDAPRVEHLVVSEGGVVLDYICKALNLPPLCYEIDWKSRIIAVADSYVILDKPAATTVGGTTDNIEESCATFASRALGLESRLILTHQIDNCTEGCVVLARTKDFCSLFHGMIREKQVKKLYLALAAAPVPIGVLSHYMRPVNLAPRLVSEDSIAGWHLCQLEVLECKAIPWPNAAVVEGYKIEDCGWPSQSSAYECQINLLTGKTHQIRAQLASIGAPIIGDSMYMPAALAEMADPSVNPFSSRQKQYASENEKMADVEEWMTRHGKEPNAGIGLQASQISWDDGKCFYEAGIPWWRRGTA